MGADTRWRRRALAGSLLCGAAGACSTSDLAPGGAARQAVAYGHDDRVEWRDVDDEGIRVRTADAVLAIVPVGRLRFGEAQVELSAAPLGAALDLCPGERFVGQPALASCTGVLVDDDLVVTASHCLASADGRDFRYVFDFAVRADGTVALDPASVYEARRVVRVGPAGTEQLALVQLDRAPTAEGRRALEIAGDGPTAGEPVLGASHGQGIPLKVDPDGRVAATPAAGGFAFDVVTDAFAGASGSAILRPDGTLLGLLQRGRQDYIESGSCRVARIVDPVDGTEHATLANTIGAEVCPTGLPSVRLCARPPVCGDGFCSADEAPSSCAGDCSAPTCGDLLCEGAERGACDADCGPRRAAGLPFDWYCSVRAYGTGDRCDCECGAPDPDCGGAALPACEAYGPLALDHPGPAPDWRLDAGGASDAGPSDAGDGAVRASPAKYWASGGCALASRGRAPGALPLALAVLLGWCMARRARRARRSSVRRLRMASGFLVPVVALVAACAHPPSSGGPPQAGALASPSPSAVSPHTDPSGSVVGARPDRDPSESLSPALFATVVSRAARGVVRLVIARPAADVGSGPAAAGVSAREAPPTEGTAIVIDERGLSVTNAHVVKGASRIDAAAPDGTLLRVDVVAVDEPTDLAVIRLSGDLRSVVPLEWAGADALTGQTALVLGNAFGAGITVSAGIVSATGREGLGYARYEDFVVTDARVTRGTSGGALVDGSGRLLGVATGTFVDGHAGPAFGLAISARLARPVILQLASGSEMPRGHLGVEVDALDPDRAAAAGYSSLDGALVTRVEPGSPAAIAGLARGDVIVEANGWPVLRRGHFRSAASIVPAGAPCPLVVVRHGERRRLVLVPQGRGAVPPRVTAPP